MPDRGPGRPKEGPSRHRWGINLWVTDAEEARLRAFFVRNPESLAEAARRLLLEEVATSSEDHFGPYMSRADVEKLGGKPHKEKP